MNEDFLHKKLEERRAQNAFRSLKLHGGKIDFCSNDYLGIVKNDLIREHEKREPASGQSVETSKPRYAYGSTGSRLLAGNYPLIEETEKYIASFHNADAALLFNSGYDANLGLLSCVPRHGDTILYDQLSHASIRDGIRLSFAQSFSFLHNDMQDLEKKLQQQAGNMFVVTESVFSMDGDFCPLQEMITLCEKYNAYLIIDEAHATGVVGEKGEGLVQHLQVEKNCFARVHTFGKACGVHGSAVIGSQALRDYLINFARPFIYTTALPEQAVAHIRFSYEVFPAMQNERNHLAKLVSLFEHVEIPFEKISSSTPIQGIIIPGNENVKRVAIGLQAKNLDVRPILYPTVPRDKERLRIVLHAFNTHTDLERLLKCLKEYKSL